MTEQELMEKSCPYSKSKLCRGSQCAMYRETTGGKMVGFVPASSTKGKSYSYCGLAGPPRL